MEPDEAGSSWGEEVGGSLEGILQGAAGEGGCSSQVEVEESCLAGVAACPQLWGNSWQPEGVEEEGRLGQGVEVGGDHLGRGEEEEEEGGVQSPEKVQ